MYNKIKKIVELNLIPYLNDHLKKIPLESHEAAKTYFFNDVEKISKYAFENFIEDENKKLNIVFIK
jgi:hypothetical protein